ncbi:MAG: hypothetical protein K0Q59_2506 [Paenibacillus sp.]|nr:hypothetical protein [Paenibacillus sp.]
MSMQIGQLMGQLLGELKPTDDAKTLELKVGQIVRGTVIQLLGEQDAMVNIGGVHLRAKLEAPLQRGQNTLLQVQPESNGSQVVLKPVSGMPAAPLGDDRLVQLLQSFGMKDVPETRQLIKQMQQAEVALTKPNVQNFQTIVAQTPPGIPADQWLEAAFVAHKRDLPMTRETVQSLRQTMFGEPLQGQMDNLEKLGEQALKALQAAPTKANGELRELLGKLSQAIQQVKEAAAQATPIQAPGQSAESEAADSTAADGSKSRLSERTDAPRQSLLDNMERSAGGGRTLALSSEASPSVPKPTTSSGADPLRLEQQVQLGQDDHDATDMRTSVQKNGQGATVEENGGQRAAREPIANGMPSVNADIEQDAADPKIHARAVQQAEQPESNRAADGKTATHLSDESAAKPQPKDNENWIARMFKAVGMDNEHQVKRAIVRADVPTASARLEHTPATLLGAALPDDQLAAPPPGQDISRHAAADSLKSVLLQLASSDALPEPLREQAQQAMQQITGQQLLLSTDARAVLSHITLFLPVRQDGSGQTAAVHVQSRKGKRGELDAHNCRLLFDLNMQTLGLTLVDVQVFDRKVHVQVHNDLPFLKPLFERYRTEIAEGLREHGYQFMAMNVVPFPERPVASSEWSTDNSSMGASSAYAMKPYKGVDVRV